MSPTRRDILKAAGSLTAALALPQLPMPNTSPVAAPAALAVESSMFSLSCRLTDGSRHTLILGLFDGFGREGHAVDQQQRDGADYFVSLSDAELEHLDTHLMGLLLTYTNAVRTRTGRTV